MDGIGRVGTGRVQEDCDLVYALDSASVANVRSALLTTSYYYSSISNPMGCSQAGMLIVVFVVRLHVAV